jgi:hypothetical protein
MRISVIIPVKNDFEYLDRVISTLLWDSPYDLDIEIIIINDGSINTDGTKLSIKYWFGHYQCVRVIENDKNYGVGYSFDRGAEMAIGDILVFTACDVFPNGGRCFYDISNLINTYPNEIGCATTIKLIPDNLNMNNDTQRYYGADLLLKYNGFNEKWKSRILRTDGNYTEILKGQWRTTLDSPEPYKITCLMGGLYFCTKEFYQKMHGFDTYKGEQFRGHMKWGHLEPFLSLKAEMYGDGCRLYPEIEVGHVFGRKTEGARGAEYQYWNALWIAYTMLEDDLRDELLDFLKPNHQYSIAQQWVKQHKNVIYEVRERNHREGKLINRL